jgi:ubiquinone/menaquinone biosynthesis C-methylase UbiE
MVSETGKSKNTRFWRDQARRYDRAIGLLNRRFDAMARDVAFAVRGRSEVLEIAAGTGLVSQRVAPEVARLVATDTSAEMLALLQQRLRAAGQTNIEIQPADALALPFTDNSFDAVVMANLLHLLPQPEAAIREATRVLRSVGILCAPTFCHGDHLVAHGVSRVLGLAGFPVVTRFSGDSLVALFESEGLEVPVCRRYPGVLPLWLIVAQRR